MNLRRAPHPTAPSLPCWNGLVIQSCVAAVQAGESSTPTEPLASCLSARIEMMLMFLNPGSQSPAESFRWALDEESVPAQASCGQEMACDFK